MFKKSLTSFVVLVMIFAFALSTCSTPAILSSVVSSAQPTVTSKLAVGLLKLEGTDQAVTAAQASTLLPLWKAINVMGNDKSASQAEVAALYQQTEDTLTAGQLAAISKVTYKQSDLSALVQKYGSSSTGQSASATKTTAANSSQAANIGPADMGGGMNDITSVGTTSSTSAATSQAASSAKTSKASTAASTDINPTFASAIVTILQKRVVLE